MFSIEELLRYILGGHAAMHEKKNRGEKSFYEKGLLTCDKRMVKVLEKHFHAALGNLGRSSLCFIIF